MYNIYKYTYIWGLHQFHAVISQFFCQVVFSRQFEGPRTSESLRAHLKRSPGYMGADVETTTSHQRRYGSLIEV